MTPAEKGAATRKYYRELREAAQKAEEAEVRSQVEALRKIRDNEAITESERLKAVSLLHEILKNRPYYY